MANRRGAVCCTTRMDASPGWYPDPGGSGQQRFWDGSAWTQRLSSEAPSDPTPPQRRGWLIPLVSVAAVVALGVATWIVWPRDGGEELPLPPSAAGTPSVTGWDEQPETALTPCTTVAPGEGGVINGDRASGGGLTFTVPSTYAAYGGRMSSLLADPATVIQRIPDTTWGNFLEVGLAPSFARLDEAAQGVLECHVTSGAFPGYVSHEVLRTEPIDVDGQVGWWVRVHAVSPEAPGGGAVYNAVAIPDEDGLGPHLFWSGVVDADPAAQAEAEDVMKGLDLAG